jgi:hypothetical protein
VAAVQVVVAAVQVVVAAVQVVVAAVQVVVAAVQVQLRLDPYVPAHGLLEHLLAIRQRSL